MVDHVKPTIRDVKPYYVMLHTGTNDLRNEKTVSQIARSITELTMSLEDNDNSVIVSEIVPEMKSSTIKQLKLMIACY